MSIDKLCLTIYKPLDEKYLKEKGSIKEDKTGMRFYKYFCQLDEAQVMWKPHRFSTETNYTMPYTKIDINPKYFSSYKSLYAYLMGLFGVEEDIDLDLFSVSRIDVKSDIEGLPIDVALARLHVSGFRRESMSLYKGSTIYIGTNPLIRIYDKAKEIKSRERKGLKLTAWEEEILKSGKQITRIEVQIRNTKRTLKDIVDDPCALVDYFDKINFYDFEADETITAMGGLQILLSRIPRKHKKEFERFKSDALKEMLRENFITSLNKWFDVDSERNKEDSDIPF